MPDLVTRLPCRRWELVLSPLGDWTLTIWLALQKRGSGYEGRGTARPSWNWRGSSTSKRRHLPHRAAGLTLNPEKPDRRPGVGGNGWFGPAVS